MTERDIFIAALQKGDPARRQAYLDEACAGRPELRRQVEQLLRLHEGAEGFLDRPAAELAATGLLPDAAERAAAREAPGAVVGPYKLLEQIGEGGMGTVWMAQQQEPVKRLVAVKLIKAGMASKQVIARFEAERQTLALMDHPNIAKVLDGGTTPAGRPYFVMDLVKGVPITRYCDEHRLTPRQRLELFIPICQAVQHAHQKGVIHRDLKPSNILIALYDGRPVPKVIDFGVAKAAGQTLTEKTLITGFGALVGTLEYMSPEQAKLNNLDIDTRSDVYSLGVLVYELLTGSTPLERGRAREAGLLEALRIIREEETPRPSARLSTAQELPGIAASRGVEPARLNGLVSVELDWIVMKALEKDRGRRHETANGFAMDVQRYLANEPVLACPPSASYRLRKFARRNKGGLAVAALVLFFLVLLGGGVGWMVCDRAARQAKMAGQVELIVTEVERLEREQKWAKALVAARQAEAAVTGGEADAVTARRGRELLEDLEFVNRLEQIRVQKATGIEGTFDNAGAVREYARAFRDHGVDVEELAVETSVERLKARPALAIPLAAGLDDWLNARRLIPEVDAAGWKRLVAVARGIDPEPLRDRVRVAWGRSASESRDELRRLAESIDVRAHHPAALVSLARTLRGVREPGPALRLLRDAQYVYPGDFWLNFELGFELNAQKDHEGAVRFYTAAVCIRPNSAGAYNCLGNALHGHRKKDEAVAAYRKAIELDPKNAPVYCNLGNALRDQAQADKAVTAFRKAIDADPKFAEAHYGLGAILCDVLRDYEKAVARFHKVIDLDPKHARAYRGLGIALSAQRKPIEAVAAYRKAIALDPEHAGDYRSLGALLCDDLKECGQAVECFRKAIELDENYATAYLGLGVALYRQKKLDEAIAACRKAIALNPNLAKAYSNLGGILCDGLKEYGQAVECFRKAIELDANDDEAYRNLGVALYLQRKPDEAVAAFRKAIELNPKHPTARDLMAWCLNELAWALATQAEPARRDPGRAVSLAKEAVELNPQSAHKGNYFSTLGTALYRAERWKDAIKALERADRQTGAGRLGFNAFFLAMAHWRSGNKDEARRWYDRAVGWMDKNQPKNDELRRFRAEASELLELTEKK
jgi:tetratricopeptide (TPR) repeat protein/serine/threonine protein kinase